MQAVASRGIFLSYRRADAAPYARLMKSELRERFPDADVFMDLDSIEAGLDFAEVIREAVDSCAVLVALIGRQWATLADEQGGRRLDDPDDYVRFEIRAALERGVRVIPVLVDDARPLRREQLPAELRKLARLNALELSYGRYEYDVTRLLDMIERVLATAPSTGPVPDSPSPTVVKTFAASHDVQPEGNVAGQAAHKDPEIIQRDRARSTRLLTDAERAAQSITDQEWKAYALSQVAVALAATDPDRAERVALSITAPNKGSVAVAEALSEAAVVLAATDPDRAERVAQSITGQKLKAYVLPQVAEALAATDPDRSERVARSITDQKLKAEALSRVAVALTATDPDRAARLLADAERLAESITDQLSKAMALRHVAVGLAAADPDRAARLLADAECAVQSITDDRQRGNKDAVLISVAVALASIDPDGAERIARSMTTGLYKGPAVRDVAVALAAIDPDRAERFAQSITDNLTWKVAVLCDVAVVLAPSDPDRAARFFADAERAAESITDQKLKASSLRYLVESLAAADPDRAERVAQSITVQSDKGWALAKVAKGLAATDPDRAARLLADAERAAQSIPDQDDKGWALAKVAEALAATDPDRAESLAQSITVQSRKIGALLDVSVALAATDPDRAEQFAQSIPDDLGCKERALQGVAEALAATDPDRAERVAQSITHPATKARTLSKIAKIETFELP